MVVDIYKNSLNENIKNKYTKPILSGKISELYENEIKELTKKLITEGSDVDLNQVKIYLPFEESLYQFNRSVLIPETAEKPIQLFIESMTDDYKEFLQESPEDILQKIEQKIRLLTSMISPNMFDKAVDADGVQAPKMAGITITIDKNFNDDDCDGDICPGEVANSDPEAAEELMDDAEAEDIEIETEDIPGTEAKVRDDMELATDSEDYEDLERMEGEAEESAEEETAEVGEQPGATEMELDMRPSNSSSEGTFTNDSDEKLSGDGEETGVDPSGECATLPGSSVQGSSKQDTNSDDEIDDLANKDEVSGEIPDEDDLQEEKDVSESKK
jgi:hypothetical protein